MHCLVGAYNTIYLQLKDVTNISIICWYNMITYELYTGQILPLRLVVSVIAGGKHNKHDKLILDQRPGTDQTHPLTYLDTCLETSCNVYVRLALALS